MMNDLFCAWPKIPRLNREMVITEKIDGTNAAIIIRELEPGDLHPQMITATFTELTDENQQPYEGLVGVFAQSRKRLITPEADNHGFADWVKTHADTLVEGLSVGRHFGEWWGQGIQRGYGMTEKRLSLFNVHRWDSEELFDQHLVDVGLDVVPTLLVHPRFCTTRIKVALSELQTEGSLAAPGYGNPEGIVVRHQASGQLFKVTCENDDSPKELVKAA